jgi:hypothetical protein
MRLECLLPVVMMLMIVSTERLPAGAQDRRNVFGVAQYPGADLEALRRALGTYSSDGRISLVDIYRAQGELQRKPGWILDEVFLEEVTAPGGGSMILPANCLRTTQKGPALWILTGIHGEEPAGPNALADNITALEAVRRKGIPLVVLPLLNPLGYQRNWRYPDVPVYSEAQPGSSVGDSDHLLPDDKGAPRRKAAACRQAALLTTRVVELAREYPPMLSLDLHEDNLLEKGYLYSQGRDGASDRVAQALVRLFVRNRFPILTEGKTRFGESITGGIVSATKDGSIDELISAPAIILNGVAQKGPSGRSVLVLETSSMHTPLAERKKLHATVLASLEEFWRLVSAER